MEEFVTQERYYGVRKGHPVLDKPKESRERVLSAYTYITYHLLEASRGTILPRTPVLHINDNLILLERLRKSDSFMLVTISDQGKLLLAFVQRKNIL